MTTRSVARERQSAAGMSPRRRPAPAPVIPLHPSGTPWPKGAVGEAVRMIARRVIAESNLRTQDALRHATGRLEAMARRELPAPQSERARKAAMRLHSGAPLPIRSLVAPLAAWTHAASQEAVAVHAALLLESGVTREVLYANVVEPCARELGDECADERCTDVDLTLGLVRLQTLVRCLGASAPQNGFVPRSVLVVAAPEECHALGTAIASECFRAAGWDVAEAPGCGDDAIAAMLRARHVDALVVSLSAAHHRIERLASLTRTIATARSADAEGELVVLVTGRDFTEDRARAQDVGADYACASAVDAPRLASALIGLQDRDDAARA